MPSRPGFDNERYLEQQSAAILERVKGSNSKLYLEFGGKLLFDYHAARQEIVRRHFNYTCEYAMGLVDRDPMDRVNPLMRDLNLTDTDRIVVSPARNAASHAEAHGKRSNGFFCGAALELPDGHIVISAPGHPNWTA